MCMCCGDVLWWCEGLTIYSPATCNSNSAIGISDIEGDGINAIVDGLIDQLRIRLETTESIIDSRLGTIATESRRDL